MYISCSTANKPPLRWATGHRTGQGSTADHHGARGSMIAHRSMPGWQAQQDPGPVAAPLALQEARVAFREFGPRGDFTASLSHVVSVGILRRKSIGPERYDSMIETELLANEEDLSEAGGGGGDARGDSSGGVKEGEHIALHTGGDSSLNAGKGVSAAGRKLRGGTLDGPATEIDNDGFGTIDLSGQV